MANKKSYYMFHQKKDGSLLMSIVTPGPNAPNKAPIVPQLLEKGEYFVVLTEAEYFELTGLRKGDKIPVFYFDNGRLSVDRDRSQRLMSPKEILNKHQKRLDELLEKELKKSKPVKKTVSRLELQISKISEGFLEKEVYEIALDSLRYADSKVDKTLVKQKLIKKISELAKLGDNARPTRIVPHSKVK